MEHLRAGGEDVTSLMPGEVFVSKFQMTISLPPASSQAWKKAIRSVVDVIDTILHINSSVLCKQIFMMVVIEKAR